MVSRAARAVKSRTNPLLSGVVLCRRRPCPLTMPVAQRAGRRCGLRAAARPPSRRQCHRSRWSALLSTPLHAGCESAAAEGASLTVTPGRPSPSWYRPLSAELLLGALLLLLQWMLRLGRLHSSAEL